MRERDARATVESVQLKEVTEELASVKSTLTISRVEDSDTRRSSSSIGKDASKVEYDVSKALVEVSGEVADSTSWKVSIIVIELKDFLKRVLAQI